MYIYVVSPFCLSWTHGVDRVDASSCLPPYLCPSISNPFLAHDWLVGVGSRPLRVSCTNLCLGRRSQEEEENSHRLKIVVGLSSLSSPYFCQLSWWGMGGTLVTVEDNPPDRDHSFSAPSLFAKSRRRRAAMQSQATRFNETSYLVDIQRPSSPNQTP